MPKLQAEISGLSLPKIIAIAFILVLGSEILSIPARAVIQTLFGYDENGSRWLGMLVSWTPMTAVAYVMMRWSNGIIPLFKVSKLSFSWVISGVVSGVLFFIILDAINNLSSNAQAEVLRANISSFRHDISVLAVIPYLAFLISFHLLVPIFEEIVYRGTIFRRVSARFGYFAGYIIASGLFASMHASRFAFTFVFSLSACFMTQKSRSLIPSIVMHATYNALVTISAFILWN